MGILPIFVSYPNTTKMKLNNPTFWSFILLIVIASLYRVIPHGLYGFPPQMAMALFAGAIIKNRKFSFLMPLFSMLVSDLLFEVLYRNGIGNTPGFYQGQWINYLLICSLTVFGFWIKNFKQTSILTASVVAPTFYFLASNFVVWAGNGGFQRSKTFAGMIQCYVDGLPFYYASLVSTIVFSALFFGCYYIFTKTANSKVTHQVV
jgi:hypothetical protein